MKRWNRCINGASAELLPGVYRCKWDDASGRLCRITCNEPISSILRPLSVTFDTRA
jgi:hypothetical protein